MKLFVFFVLISFGSFGFELKLELPEVYLESSELDSTLENNQAILEFNFSNFGLSEEVVISYQIDSLFGTFNLNSGKHLELITTPGMHHIQFFASQFYNEIYTDLAATPKTRDHYLITFRSAEMLQMAEKPVIYLYPKEATKVHVEVKPNADFSFTYPKYQNGWDFTAQPDGTLEFDALTYKYLFWEAPVEYVSTSNEYGRGVNVSGADAVKFLEEKLTEAGLNSQEKADFITFWGPRLAQNKHNLVYFLFNERCDQFAQLKVTPEPENIYRIYMIWSPTTAEHPSTPMTMTPMDRTGFTVVEWGGIEQ